jgi:UDP-N-acetylmuramyl tripeptide synthase
MKSALWVGHRLRNRRSERPVVERIIEFDATDEQQLEEQWDEFTKNVLNVLRDGGLLDREESFPVEARFDDARERFAYFYVQLSLRIQQYCGHRVSWFSLRPRPEQNRILCLVEHEHCDVGMNCDRLAWEVVAGGRQQIVGPLSQLRFFAAERIMPLDTAAIVSAAERRNIPVWKMDRYPYGRNLKDEDVAAGALRRNGLLRLGHGRNGLEVEGTFCKSRSPEAAALLSGRCSFESLCRKWNIPLRGNAPGAMSERRRVLISGGAITSVLREDDRLCGSRERDDMHTSYIETAQRIFRKLDSGMLAVEFQSHDFSRPVGEAGYVTGIDPAPDLRRGIAESTGLLEQLAESFVDWLFAGTSGLRIPIVAVTGSNGKTTTSRMIAQILEDAGHTVGLACTDGVFVGDEVLATGDLGGLSGHVPVLFDARVTAAVLETHHNSLFQEGIAYDGSDVAVCTGVTEEHIRPGMVESVEQMARVKGFLLENARDTVIINADNVGCRRMLCGVSAERTGRVSTQSRANEVIQRCEHGVFHCLLETGEEQGTIVLIDSDQRIPVMNVAEIPVTFAGRAKFNVRNAMYAISATHALGIDIEVIRSALSRFEAGPEATPGRLNFHDNGRFRVLVDFAHNADGLNELCHFVDRIPAAGRKILLFAMSGDRGDDAIEAAGKAVAGHFDLYLCRRYPMARGRSDREVPDLLASALVSAGVASDRVLKQYDPEEAVTRALGLGEAGDLLVMTHGSAEFPVMWSAVTAV